MLREIIYGLAFMTVEAGTTLNIMTLLHYFHMH